MRAIFAGTPEFARVALAALHAAGHDIVAVFTQPDRAAGRGLTLAQSPVKQEALRCGLLVVQPQSLRSGKPGAQDAMALLKQLRPDLMVVAAYGLLLPKRFWTFRVWDASIFMHPYCRAGGGQHRFSARWRRATPKRESP